ncbi:MAG: hypothetical protein QOD72_828 [Acidimicrobiaceae bacterium]|nr:hypothetical protein [Acidimicrobiaceae bacterium]
MAMRGRPTPVVVLSDDERETLSRWARRPTLATNFITGGGYLINPTNTAGSFAPEAGRKTNLGVQR